eukprot:g525.t1
MDSQEETWTEISEVEENVKTGDKQGANSVLTLSSKSSDRIPAMTPDQTTGSPSRFVAFRAMRDELRSFLETRLGWIGYVISLRPWLTVLICCSVSLALSTGCLFVEAETRSDVIWSPDATLAKQSKDYVKRVYPKSSSIHQFILTSYPQGKNILTLEGLEASSKVDNLIKGIEVSSVKNETESLGYTDLCYKNGIACWHVSVLQITGISHSVLSNSDRILEKLNRAIRAIQGTLPVRLEDVLGGVVKNEDGYIEEAKAAAFTYFIRNQDDQGNNAEKIALQWEDKYLQLLTELQPQMHKDGFHITWIGENSFDREIKESLQSETWMLYIAILLITSYTILMLSKWSNGFIGSRAVLAVSGITSIGLAIGASIGTCVYFGVTYSQLIGLVPVLMLGIGVDNMFILVNAFDRIKEELKAENKISQVLATSGASITLTSMTNCFAFMIGAQTAVPALRCFSIYAACGVVFNFILQITLFPALLAIDSRRQESNRYDVLFCIAKPAMDQDQVSYISILGIVDRAISSSLHSLGHQISKHWVKPIVLVLFGALAGIGIWGTINIEVQTDSFNFIPPDSYIRSYEDTRTVFFPTIGDRTALYLKDVDFSSPKTWREMNEAFEAFSNDESIESDSLINWFRSYQKYINSSKTREMHRVNFTSGVAAWIKEDVVLSGGSAFVDDVVFTDDHSSIRSCKFHGNHKLLASIKERAQAMDSVREIISSLDGEVASKAFVYGDKYLAYEMYKRIGKEAVRNITFGLIMVFVVAFLLLMNIKATILTWLNIVLILVELVGLLYIWGYDLDTTLTIFLIASMGLAVDYSAHFVHAFLNTCGKLEDRVQLAMGSVGPAITNAAMSTLCAVCILAISDSFVFKLFFRAFFLCVLLSMFHALMLLPTCFSLFPTWSDEKEESTSSSVSAELPDESIEVVNEADLTDDELNSDSECSNIPNKKVIVVGAGVAGISAALFLKKHNVETIVLEGRDRIGGRIYTDYNTFSTPVDLGASIITGTDLDPSGKSPCDPCGPICRALGLSLHFLDSQRLPLYHEHFKAQPIPKTIDKQSAMMFDRILDEIAESQSKEGKSEDPQTSLGSLFFQYLEQYMEKMNAPKTLADLLAPQGDAEMVLASSKQKRPSNQDESIDHNKIEKEQTPVSKKLKVTCLGQEDVVLDIITKPVSPSLVPTTPPDLKQDSIEDTKLPNGEVHDAGDDQMEAKVDVVMWHKAHLEYGCGTSLNNVSCVHWNQDEDFGGFNGRHAVVKGGLAPLLERLGRDLDIRLEQVVNRIQYGPDGVQVWTTSGECFEVGIVICTMPLGVLKSNSIQFVPPLPLWKQQAIENIGFGNLNKIVLEFTSAFWDQNVDYFGLVPHSSTNKQGMEVDYEGAGFCFMFNTCLRFTGKAILTGVISGHMANEIEDLEDDIIISKALENLTRVFGSQVKEFFLRGKVTRWKSDIFSRGCYTYIPIGASGTGYENLSHPILGHGYGVLFGGEHTNKEHPDTIGGAMITGKRNSHHVEDKHAIC